MQTIFERFDKENKHRNFKYIAEDLEGSTVVGYIYIDMPWYSPETSWVYIIRSQRYIGNYGGFEWIDTVVSKDTIRPCNQINMIKKWLKDGSNVTIEVDSETTIDLAPGDEIPYSMWNNM